MKRKKYKIISLILAIVLSISCITPVMATDANTEEPDSTQCAPLYEITDPSGSGKYLWRAAFKVAKWILVKADNALFNRDPQIIDKGGNWMASSSGSVSFGNGPDDVRRVKFETTVSERYNHLDAFAQTGITGWLDTITIFIENSNGNEIHGGQVNDGQHILTSNDLPLDTYTTYYVYSSKRKWDCWLYRYDFTDDYTRSASSPDITSNMVYNPDTQKSYIIPSDSVVQSKITKDGALTAQDLVNEFYDDQLNCSVHRMKNYNIDDTIYVTDIITNLQYDDSTDITTIYFGNTTDGSFFWPFAGDLRNQFAVNDELTFKFNVVEEYATNEYSFETLDYFLESYDLFKADTAANIEDYLVR